MRFRKFVGLAAVGLLLWPALLPAQAEDFTNALHALLQRRVEVEKKDFAIVVGLVDEHGTTIVSCGKADNATGQDANGDTLFELGSITKTFTGLLLEDMVERGEMKLDDPVARHLPKSVKIPAHNGKAITLAHLATHTSGLPFLPANLHPKRMDNPYADYTAEELYSFLADFKLKQDPGKKYDYSDVGMELLGEAIAFRAGTNYESLLVDRICRPLRLDSTRITLTPELKARLARGHNPLGQPLPALEFQTLVGASALHSTANDLLKYIAANLGLVPSSLTPIMQRAHEPRFKIGGWCYAGLNWVTTCDLPGTELVFHGGETLGHSSWIGMDKRRRRGVVVLSSSSPEVLGVVRLGWLLLESEWRPDCRPQSAQARIQFPEAAIGQYRLAPSFRLGVFALKAILRKAPKWAVALTSMICLAALVWLLRRAPRSRIIRIILGCLVLIFLGTLVAAPLITSRVVCKEFQPVIGVRREGDRVLAQLLRITAELAPQSETCWFERMSGLPLVFAKGKPRQLTLELAGTAFPFAKFTNQPPEVPAPPVAFKLDPKRYDDYVGRYEFAPDELFPDGLNVTIRRQGDQLTAEGANTNGALGAVDICPTSETNFLMTIGGELIFSRNEKGEATNAVRRIPGWADVSAKRIK